MATTSKLERDRQKLVQDKCQQILADLLKDEDNKYCVDCDSKGPRWASWNLGIFLCIRCAGLHRNLGVHISKVKSVNLDSWTPEQIGSIQNMGNSKARAVYEANLPDNFSRPQTNTALEKFIRSKYEQKKYIAKEWVNTPPKPAFDIETELKKEKEKKRNKIKPIASISTTEIQSTPLPRPNVNGKTEKTTKSDDLLGLDLSGGSVATTNISANDEFGFFASADTSATSVAAVPVVAANGSSLIDTTVSTASNEAKASESTNLDKEEHDFFNQKVPDPVEKGKMTKESILSLYAKAPAPNAFMTGGGAVGVGVATAGGGNQFNALGGKTFAQNVMASTNPFLANNGLSATAAATPAASSLFGDLNLSTQPSNPVNHIAQGITSLQLDTRNTQSSEFFDGLMNNAVRKSFDSFNLSSRPPAAITAMPTNTANPFLEAGGGSLSGLSMFTTNNNTNPLNTSSLSNLNFDAFSGLSSGTPSSLLTSAATQKPESTGNNNLTNLW